MQKNKFTNLKPVGKCKVCGINLWTEYDNKPAIWPCGIETCPYPDKPQTRLELSATGSSLSLPVYEG